jgi:hypothetical protein
MSGLVPAWAVYSLLVAALVAANLPFVNQRILVLGPRLPQKAAWVRLLELLFWCGVVAAVGRGLEGHVGQVSAQRWEFYAVWACVFLTLASPGFVWRYLRRGAE